MNKFTFLITATLLFLISCGDEKRNNTEDIWAQADLIKEQIVVPEFPDTSFVITNFGAKGNGETMSTEAFRKAISAANENGGGRVVVPEGTFLTGAIHLKSNVNLHLADEATILFSRNPEDYLPLVESRWEGMELMNYSAFIYANEQENIAITGSGTLDGNATLEHWWSWKGDDEDGWEEGMPNQLDGVARLHQMNEDRVPTEERKFGEGHYLRPNFVQFMNSKNILISGVKLVRSPMWTIHPVLSENITIDGIHIESLGPNNDGVNPESSKNVLITNSYFDTGDDCIAIKSGRDEDGREINIPSENIVIENSQMRDGHGGIVMGSEIAGGVRNIFARNLEMDSPNLDRILRIKTSANRGGTTERVYLKDIRVGQYNEAAIRVNMFYDDGGEHIPTVRDIVVENLQVENGGEYGILIEAYEESPVTNLKIINSSILGVEVPTQINHAKNLLFEDFSINGEILSPENL